MAATQGGSKSSGRDGSSIADTTDISEAALRDYDDDAAARQHELLEAAKRQVEASASFESAMGREPAGFPDGPSDAALLGIEETTAYEQRFAREVSEQVRLMRVRDSAKDLYAAEKRGRIVVPALQGLADFLAVPDDEVRYRIDQIFPVGARVMLAAQYKAGKSTMVGNLGRSLVDGDPFLGQYEVEPLQRVVLIDVELDERTLRRWLRAQGIRSPQSICVVSLRGRISSFNILDADVRAAWAQALRGAQFVVLDCLRPILDALGLDENHDAGRFLTAFDELLGMAGVPEALVVHHMGHAGERSRGDSRLQDWPDVTWKLVREEPDNPASPRYFSAFGRDVDVKETALGYDEAARRLTLGEGSRKDAKVAEAVEAIVALLGEHEALSGRQVEQHLAEGPHTQKEIRAALRLAHETGRTITYGGARNATMHSLKPVSESVR